VFGHLLLSPGIIFIIDPKYMNIYLFVRCKKVKTKLINVAITNISNI